MDGQTILILGIIAVPILALTIYSIVSRPQIMVGRATVLSHRVEFAKVGSRWSTGWNYLVTFQMTDGSEMELYTTEEEHQVLDDGQTGLLTWDKDLFYHFDPDVPQ